jgi:hypothetical protein
MRGTLALLLVSTLSALSTAQQSSSTEIQKEILVVGELTHAIDGKKANVGDTVTLHLVNVFGGSGALLVPDKKGKVIGHISEVHRPSKENPQSMVAIRFDRIEVKGAGGGLPINGTIQSMVAPSHMKLPDSGIPTSGDNPMGRASGPFEDSYGRPVRPPPVPLSRPGPRAAAGNNQSSGIEGMAFRAYPKTQTTVITTDKKRLLIENGTEITLVASSRATP